MKTRILSVALISLITGASYNSCAPSEKKVEEANQKVDEAKKNLDSAEAEAKARTEEWLKYKRESENTTMENDRKIAELRTEMAKEKKSVQVNYEKQVNELEQKNKSIKQKLIDFKSDSKQSWDTLKVEVDKNIREFDHDFEGLTVALKNFTKKNNP